MSPHYSCKGKRIRVYWDRWFRERTKLFGCCLYCGTQLTSSLDTTSPVSETKDHVIPKCRGGAFTVKVCRQCNGEKGNLTLNEYRAVLSIRHHCPHLFVFEKANAKIALMLLLVRIQLLARCLC